MKKLTIALFAVMAVTLTGCGENSDGSNPMTYSSCSIVDSNALLADNRAIDIQQCWDGVDIGEKAKAMDWCGKKVNSYLAKRYTVVTHDVQWQVASTNCPKI